MPFIGTQPDVGGYSVLDALTASATASYTLQKDSANFSPSSANQLLVSLNGVIQKPGSSFTVSGSTLTFSSALTSSDSIDFILAMGEPLLIGTPSDGTVSTAKIANDAVTGAKIENNPTIAGNLTVSGTSTSTGTITASAGVVIPNGQGIDFSATSDTGGVASELLDDYEEGTFAVQLGSDSSATLPTFTDTGYYVKIGKIVHLHGQVTVSGSSSGGSNLHVLLPFTVTNARGALAIGLNQPLGMQSNGEYLNIITELNSNKGYLISHAFGGGHTHLNFNNCGTGIFSFSGSIRVA